MSGNSFDAIVIGEGISGLTAAGALAGAGLRVASMEAQLFGGLVINVNELEPAPAGYPPSGSELAAQLMQANADAGVTSIQEGVTALRGVDGGYQVTTDSSAYRARCVIVASGARLRKLDVPGESDFEGRGVSQCADCDGPMYQNEHAIVVGGGDSALQEALVLAHYCRRVLIVHRGEHWRAMPHFVAKVEREPKITVLRNTTVTAILGNKMVEAARLQHADGGVQEEPCAGVFPYIGLVPNAAFMPDEAQRDPQGFLRTYEGGATSLPGVYAVGAVRSAFPGTLDAAMDEAHRVAGAVRARLA